MAKKTKENWQDLYPMTEELLSRMAMVEKLVRNLSEHKMKKDPEAAVFRRVKRARIVACTQANFERLPGMVSRSEFQDWTGLNSRDLSEAVRLGEIDVYKPDEHSCARYYKREIARLTGFKL